MLKSSQSPVEEALGSSTRLSANYCLGPSSKLGAGRVSRMSPTSRARLSCCAKAAHEESWNRGRSDCSMRRSQARAGAAQAVVDTAARARCTSGSAVPLAAASAAAACAAAAPKESRCNGHSRPSASAIAAASSAAAGWRKTVSGRASGTEEPDGVYVAPWMPRSALGTLQGKRGRRQSKPAALPADRAACGLVRSPMG